MNNNLENISSDNKKKGVPSNNGGFPPIYICQPDLYKKKVTKERGFKTNIIKNTSITTILNTKSKPLIKINNDDNIDEVDDLY